MYHARFSYHCILFTNNQDIIRFFEHSVCKVITDFKRNPYGLPYIYSMYSIASTVYKAKYYGYLNSDILIEPVVFSVLDHLDKQARAGSISPYHELAGRVHPIDTTALPVGFSSLEEMENLNKAYTRSDAQSLVGSYVIIKTQDSSGDDKYVSGLVDYVTMINNKPYFSINDNYYAYEDLDSVVDADYINSLDKDKDKDSKK